MKGRRERKKAAGRALLWLGVLLLLAGCGGSPGREIQKRDHLEEAAANGGKVEASEEAMAEAPQEEEPNQEPADPRESIDLSLKPDESGKVMVLMYHNIGPEEKEWVRTPENFLKDLEVLYEKGYRPVSLTDFVTGRIPTEAGKTPVVITFDDGNLNNFEYLEDGSLNPLSAVGLLLAFHEEHTDFPLEATFFLDGSQPFRQQGMEGKKLDFLIEKGMDVGNHTKGHDNLSKADGAKIQQAIGAQAQFLEGLIGQEGYRVETLALPYGGRPKDEALKAYLGAGSFEGVPYGNIAVLNVGWHPAHSPYDSRFDPLSIPRIRASEMKVDNVGLYNYLEYFDKHPEERFVSDGNPEVVTVPEGKQERLKELDGMQLYIYQNQQEKEME
ncbi:polysaccharide deacetylase family protein [Anaerotalea alkaliphila]|uniref:Polysaccharide deacetylase family protein n=1 Tax=Anaerotalea alkaliphila TaxID=2662126 RepID=A0A7X5KNB5_9FIRM|nr:polysaccharide deacetylase family protein [Anaerotalea alkaliphila]NDL66602.1 polysaccharide deacetylase family protein [Anaerotalea alkaliphila]